MLPGAISRRTMLKGLGAAIALPWLDAMLPVPLLASTNQPRITPPRRMAFFYVPNGMHMQDWTPAKEGADFELPETLQPLAGVKDKVLVFSGLALDKARPNGDGPGDHARAMSTFLTGVQIKKTNGADIRCGISVDQVGAMKIGHKTKLPSLEVGTEGGRQAGNCDSGYSCAYSSSISWRSEATPMIKETDPRQVFERLFGNGMAGESAASRAKRERQQKSILDFVLDDAKRLKDQLGATDQRKMEEYLTAVREIETRIGRIEKQDGDRPMPKFDRPAGTPKDYDEHLRLLSDLMVLAFQGDVTRIGTYVLANDGSNRSYKFIEVPEGHHDLSHHGGDKAKQAKIKKINHFHISQFAYLVNKLNSIPEGDGTLLDHCMLGYGSGIGDGNRHNHDELPVVVVGSGSGSLKTGRHVRYPKDTPLTNLWVSMLDRIDASVPSLGDSNGRLTDLS